MFLYVVVYFLATEVKGSIYYYLILIITLNNIINPSLPLMSCKFTSCKRYYLLFLFILYVPLLFAQRKGRENSLLIIKLTII